MGKLLDDVQHHADRYHRAEAALEEARRALRITMNNAHNEGISMNRIAQAAGFTREGVRYALGQKGGADGQQ